MSDSARYRTIAACVAAVAVLAISGCGSDEPQPPTSAPSQATGSDTGPVAGAHGATQPSSADQVSPNDPGDGDEEAASTPVDIGLEDGNFTKRTAKTVHVAPYIAVAITFRVLDDLTYTVTVLKGEESFPQSLSPGAVKAVKIDGLRPGKTIEVVIGDARSGVTIDADADPGP